MKRLLALTLSTMLLLALGGCGATPPSSSSEAPSLSVAPPAPTPTPAPAPTPGSSAPASSTAPQPISPAGPKQPPIPADAAMYRGTVSDLVSGTATASGSTEKACAFTLTQAEGTNYGAPSLKFVFTENTYADFAPEAGQYLEVYYGRVPGAPLDEKAAHQVITAIRYHSAEMVNYNGYIKAITPHPEKPNEGRLVMVPTPEDVKGDPMPAPGEIHFNYGKDTTQFYLNFDELKVGDHLNIFQSGAMAMSMPPQSFAIEVRKYAEGAK